MRLVIVDQSLVGVSGHHAEYTRCIAKEAAKSAAVTILANYNCEIRSASGIDVRPTFRRAWTQAQRLRASAGYDPTASFPAWSFLADLRGGLAALDLCPEDHVFIHSIGFTEVEDILTYLTTSERSKAPIFDILLRRDLDEIRDDEIAYKRFVAYVKAFAGLGLWPKHVRFFTDTQELTDQYTEATGIPFTTVAIPFEHEAMRAAIAARPRRVAQDPVIVGYLGDARPEKGYQFLPPVVTKLMHSHLLPGKMRLRLQSNYNLPGGETPEMPRARRTLQRYGAAVELLLEPLDQDAYYQQLAEMDIIVVPYVAERYAKRSSGIFVQAVAAGKVVVAPRGTTMFNEAQRYRMRNCVFYDNPKDLPSAVAEAVDRYAELVSQSKHRERWLTANSPAALVKTLLHSDRQVAVTLQREKKPLVLHIIDGHCTFDRTGSGALQEAQLRFLSAAGYRFATVYVVRTYPSDFDLVKWIERNYQYWFDSGSTFSWLVYLAQPPKESPPGLQRELDTTELFSVPETLQGVIASGEVDLVWTNYVTTEPLLDILQLRGRVPSILETVDVQSFQYAIQNDREVDPEELQLELSLWERFDKLISLSAPESLLMKEHLGEARVAAIAPPFLQAPLSIDDLAGAQNLAEVVSSAESNLQFVDFNEVHARNEFRQFERLSQCAGIDLLFVSSVHPPNMLSFDWFLDNVYGPKLAPLGVTLLLAGSLSTTEWALERQRRFPDTLFLAGRVTSLRPLYAAAKIIVLPITHGAGVNIKTIDALSLGKPIVATSMALRGLAEAEAAIKPCDDADSFAERIVELLSDTAVRRAEAETNWKIAAGLRDVGTYFQKIAKVFASLLGDRALSPKASGTADKWEFIEWDQRFDVLNKFARALIEKLPYLPALGEPLERLLAIPGTPQMLWRILATVAYRKSAPILKTQSYLTSYLPTDDADCKSDKSELDVISEIFVRALLPYSKLKTALSTLAGCSSLTDVFRASGACLSEVQSLQEIDVVVLAQGLPGHSYRVFSESFMDFYERCYVPHLGPKRVRIVIVGDIGVTANLPGVYQLRNVGDPAPVVAAAHVVLAPWNDLATMHPAATATVLQALASGKPLVATSPSLWFMGDAAKAAFATDSHEQCAERILDLLNDAEKRLAARTTTAAIASQIFGDSSASDELERPQASLDSGAITSDIRFQEWSPWIRWCGDMIIKVINRYAVSTVDLRTLEDELKQAATRTAWDEIIGAVFVRGDAPILRYDQTYSALRTRTPQIKNLDDFIFELKKLAFESSKNNRSSKVAAATPHNGESLSSHLEGVSLEAYALAGNDGAYYAPTAMSEIGSPEGRNRAKPAPIGSAGPDPRSILLDADGRIVELNLSGRMCGAGWYAAEFTPSGYHRWTGPDPSFSLEIFLPDEPYRCEMRMLPAQSKNFESFSIEIDGQEQAFRSQHLDDGTVRVTFDIPKRQLQSYPAPAVVSFRHATVCSPADWGETDNRMLGLSVRSITFLRAAGASSKDDTLGPRR